jgi:hypothetical protein
MRGQLVALCLVCLSLFPLSGMALEITGVSPGVVSSGSAVTVIGGPFSKDVKVLLGERQITPSAVEERQLVFTVPPLETGEYALFLKQEGQASPQTFTLRIVEPTPRIDSLSPTNIDVCSTEDERRIVVAGRHFLPGATLLMEGSALPYTRTNEGELTFTAPSLEAGIYGIQVVNPDGARSLPHSLWFNDIPEILNVHVGEEFVNYYQLIIEGKNFSAKATLVVNEYAPGVFDIPPQQLVLSASGAASGTAPLQRPSQADNFRHLDCNTLVYNRYPVSSQAREVTLQVVNPDGKQTPPYHLTTP